jgi:thiol-disulfide isomerase/thioredoxin
MKIRSKTCVAHRRRRPVTESRLRLLALLLLVAPAFSGVRAELPAPDLSYELTRLDTPLPAPDFRLMDMDGEPHSLGDYRGKVVMLNFWATWCPPCRREIPSMESIYRDLHKDGFMVLAVNEFEDTDHVFAYTGQLSVFPTFPILFDTDSQVSQDYQVRGLPTTLLIDKQGRIVYRAVGGRDFDHPAVREIVRALLAGH